MKFICNKETIFHEISNAKDFTSQKTAENQYTFVYLELSNNNLIIKTTDQKMGYYSIVNVNGEENGSLMVNCDKFFLKFEKMFFTVCLNFSPGRCYNSYSG